VRVSERHVDLARKPLRARVALGRLPPDAFGEIGGAGVEMREYPARERDLEIPVQ
jgi:hypothetical protein